MATSPVIEGVKGQRDQGMVSLNEASSALLNNLGGGTRAPASRKKVREGGFNAAAHGLRGLAAMMVLIAHILGGTAKHIYADHPAYVEAVKAPWYLGTFGVELFFVISGFVILPSAMRYAPREFALRRFLRLYPLFFVLSLLFVALNAATNAYPAINTVIALLAGFFFLNLFVGTEQLTPNAWSLTYEVMFYILMYGIVHFAVRRRHWFGGVAVLAGLAFLIAFPIAIYFVMGAAIRLASRHEWQVPVNRRLIEAASLILMIGFASQGHFEYLWSDFANPVVVPIIIFTGIYFYFAVMPGSLTAAALDNPVMRYLGTVSYSLYLVHPYTYFLARQVFDRMGLFTDSVGLSIAIFSCVVVAITIPLTHLVHVSLELWPYQHFFRQRIYREKTAVQPPSVPGVQESHA
ncbi:MAG: acyltransferase [Sphingobium sp.]|uniref:acyltransferase family protein n=1 Tax=Sphingobium sp. TaxID=1912891 RepID=UPI0029AE6B5E|nr:acyltransferase [Sphingobium sp.]MDX3909586.1 acyltransferase [Sphingobium sp.]